jgi:hypothetical protein
LTSGAASGGWDGAVLVDVDGTTGEDVTALRAVGAAWVAADDSTVAGARDVQAVPANTTATSAVIAGRRRCPRLLVIGRAYDAPRPCFRR